MSNQSSQKKAAAAVMAAWVPPADGEELLRVAPDIVAITKLSKSYIHDEIAAVRLRAYKFGRATRVRRADLEAWISTRGVSRPPEAA